MNHKIANDIFRQRFLIEGYYTIEVNQEVVNHYLRDLASVLNLRIYRDPIVYSPTSTGKKKNQGFDAFVPLIDSGISVYIWSNKKFFSIIIYTCKGFDEKLAETFTCDFFKVEGKIYISSF